MIVKVVESLGVKEPFNQEVLMVSFNDAKFVFMTKNFLRKFNTGQVDLFINEKSEYIFMDRNRNVMSKYNGVYDL